MNASEGELPSKPLFGRSIALILTLAAPAIRAQAPATRMAIIDIQSAIANTQEGRHAAAELESKFNLRKSQLQIRQEHIQALQNQLRQGSATLNEDAKAKLARDIQTQTKSLNREAEDLNDEQEQEQSKIARDLYTKMIAVVEKYSTANGYTMVLDTGNPQTPGVWAAASTNITADAAKQYDQAHPASSPRK